jgi:hypothetical protein
MPSNMEQNLHENFSGYIFSETGYRNFSRFEFRKFGISTLSVPESEIKTSQIRIRNESENVCSNYVNVVLIAGPLTSALSERVYK